MGVGMHRTSSNKTEVASWFGDEDQEDCVAGVVITITPTGDFRIMRIAMAFDAAVVPNIVINQDNRAGAAWDQVIVDYTPPGAINDFSFFGGVGYEYEQGNAIVITISAVAANVNLSWEMEQI